MLVAGEAIACAPSATLALTAQEAAAETSSAAFAVAAAAATLVAHEGFACAPSATLALTTPEAAGLALASAAGRAFAIALACACRDATVAARGQPTAEAEDFATTSRAAAGEPVAAPRQVTAGRSSSC